MEVVDKASDDGLIAAAVKGDTAAFGRLVARHQSAARHLAAALVGPADADDVAQEAFVRAYRALASFRPGSPFRPWLLRIVANLAGNHRRGAQRRERRTARVAALVDAGGPRPGEPGPGEQVEQADDRRRLTEALDRLPHKDREVLVIRYLLEFSEEETAAVLGCPRGTVKSRSARALQKLRAHIDSGSGEGAGDR